MLSIAVGAANLGEDRDTTKWMTKSLREARAQNFCESSSSWQAKSAKKFIDTILVG